jgi:RNA ligase (TIGR02306 family)
MPQATIRQISELRPIVNADRIELAIIDGWQCVVGKDNGYKVGDLCVFIEIDSFVPFDDALGRYDFLKDKNGKVTVFNGVEGARIKTIRLRKQISQGLTLPLKVIYRQGEWSWVLPITEEVELCVEVGDDVTDALRIQHWEKPIPAQLAGTVRSTFPRFIHKTDQERVQNLTGTIQDFVDEEFEVTIKLDGSSMTVYVYDDDYGVCSRNMSLIEDDNNAFWKVAKDLDLIGKLRAYGKNLALQGELVGPGVQGNWDELAKLDFYVFDLFDIDKQEYLQPDERIVVLGEIDPNYTIKHVPFIKYGPRYFKLSEFMTPGEGKLLENLLEFANGESLNRSKKREGLVFKHRKSPFSFKVLNNKFLLEKGE